MTSAMAETTTLSARHANSSRSRGVTESNASANPTSANGTVGIESPTSLALASSILARSRRDFRNLNSAADFTCLDNAGCILGLVSERESVRPLRGEACAADERGEAYAACVLGRLILGSDAKSFHRSGFRRCIPEQHDDRKSKSVAKTPQVSEGSQQTQSPVDPASWREWPA